MKTLRALTSALGLAICTLSFACTRADAATFTHSVVVERDGNPTLLVDGKPFFFYGAAFFYERIPAQQWERSMEALAKMGFNTLDLYVPWNWHELSDGDFDFDGRTNPSRNVREVLRLGAKHGFHFIVRPGPVIRNEWRNGGYPAWLLTRPEYGMPLHDVLEGRYPATATLQNENSDDAAAQWMNNSTHMQYAARWLQTAMREFVPVADRVLAVQLDDDQGAYIDNQTWPAPHFQAYLASLESTIRSVTGPQIPCFINTYQMKVTASAPVWPMGNWYQSDAYSIGEHDRSALEFSTALLQTQTHWPVAISEFQAGWLAQPEDPQPRPADPTNTTLALHTMLGFGARGIVDFPAQDTVNPAGWEAPFANASYAWDAALRTNLDKSDRYAPTAAMGQLVRQYGPILASARRVADGAIAYTLTAYPVELADNATVFSIAARTQSLQRACREARLTCDLIDLRFVSDASLARLPFVVVPQIVGKSMAADILAKLTRYRARGGRILETLPHVPTPAAGGIANATLLISGRAAFLDVVNYDSLPVAIANAKIHARGKTWLLEAFTIGARGAVLVDLNHPVPKDHAQRLTLDSDLTNAHRIQHVAPYVPTVVLSEDVADDGFDRITIGDGSISAVFRPNAGGRLTDMHAGHPAALPVQFTNLVTSVGAFRDDVEIQPVLSTTDRIGKYTRSFPAGMFNRPYTVSAKTTNSFTLSYDAPDVVPNGAHFERTVSMRKNENRVVVDQGVRFAPGPDAGKQRGITYSSFDTQTRSTIDDRTNSAVGFYDAKAQSLTIYAWRAGDVEDAQIIPERTSTVVRLRFAPGGTRRCSLGIARVENLEQARAALQKEESALAANR